MSYESYAHAQDLVDVEELNSITMKGISREIKVFSVIGDLNPENPLNNAADQSLVTNSRNALELRVERLEKHIAELASKVR